MGILTEALGLSRRSVEDPSHPLTATQLGEMFAGPPSATGKRVSQEGALRVVAVYACVRVLAETLATLPIHTYRRLRPVGREKAIEHHLYWLLYSTPNPEMTRVEFLECMEGHVVLWGNAYAEIVYNGAGLPAQLWILRPDRTRALRDEAGNLVYDTVLPNGQTVRLPAYRVLHIKGLSPDGYTGYSPIALAREAVGLALATEEFGARWFGNGSRPSGVLTKETPWKDKAAIQRVRESWQASHGGLETSHRVAILEEGLKWQQIGIPPEDAQFLETRKFQRSEIASLFRVPPHMIGDLEKATFSNIEHQSLSFVVHTMRPWLVRWEQGLDRALLTEKERREYYVRFSVDGLLRGDAKSRAEANAIKRQNGVINADEWREQEDMNPIEDGSGKFYLVNGNMVKPGATPADEPTDTPAEEQDDSDKK
jgi:HK97 family phage portal protein